MDKYSNKTREELLQDLEQLQQQYEILLVKSRDLIFPDSKQKIFESEYLHILEEIDDGYWETDLHGAFTYCNEAMSRILGYSREELKGMNNRDYMDAEVAREVYNHFNQLYHKGSGSKTIVYELIRKDKTTRVVEISVSLIRSSSSGATGFRGILRDITERQYTRDLEQNFNMMRKALGQTVQALSLAFEVRDPYTAGHHRRVSDLARSIATELGISRDVIEGIRIAGSIHDIGKISIPAEILSKPGQLTDIEFKLIKTHPQMGYDILKNIDFPWPIAKIVAQHHERINGSGYPYGLKGKDIILESKILSVADVVEAMSSHRPYRRAIGTERALEEIRNNQGTLYCVDCVDACIKIFSEKGYILPD